MAEDEDDLRATAEAVAADAERLAEIEAQKLTLSIDDPRLLELSDEAEAIAGDIVIKTAAETTIAEGADLPKR